MEFDALIAKRRSIRHFDESKPVTKQQLEEIIRTAMEAPSWKNYQTARFHCILDKKLKDEFLEMALPPFNAKNSLGAGAIVVTTFIKDRSGFDKKTASPVNECGNGFGYYDLGLNNQNFVLKAADMGLGTLIMGIRDKAAICRLLDIGNDEEVVSVIAVGYPSKDSPRPERKATAVVAKFY